MVDRLFVLKEVMSKVIAMKVNGVSAHPNADALKIYQCSAPEHAGLQIVSNVENIYEIDDLIYVALEGSLLKDGTSIKSTKLRGVQSYGMAMGKVNKPGIKLGDDFTEEFCKENISGDTQMIKWVDIESCFNVRSYLRKQHLHPKLAYSLKIKLHGTNGSIQLTNDGIFAQSRSRVITPSDDNAGFASWVNDNIDLFKTIPVTNSVITIFGEWAGKGLQSGVGISQIDRKIFAVFAIQYGGRDGYVAEFEVEPDKIRKVIPEHPDIFVLPWQESNLMCNFGNDVELDNFIDHLNKVVSDVEAIDPWVKAEFGIEGIGEGIVAYPIFEESARITRDVYNEYVFKAKGEKHRGVKVKRPVQLDPELVKNIDEFVALFLTDARLKQGVGAACNDEYNMRYTGSFIKWFTQDVKKESVAELEAADFEWKQVAKYISMAAAIWYKKKCQRL